MNKHLVFSLIFMVLAYSISAEEFEYEIVTIENQSYYLYPVQKSEGFYALKKRFGLTQEEIIAVNPELSNGLKLGQEIKIPIKKSKKTVTPPASQLIIIAQHKVKSSETLYSISRKYNIEVEDLLEINPWASIGIKSKDILQIPHRSIVNTEHNDNSAAPATVLPETNRKHKVRRKETLYSISRKYKVNIDQLIELNPWTTSGLKTGECLSIPLSEKEKLKRREREEKAAKKEQKKESEEKEKEKEKYRALGEKAFGKKHDQDSTITIDSIVMTDTITIDLDSLFALKDTLTSVKIAILLPFSTAEEYNSYPILEFYEGCRLAIEQQKSKGLSIELLTMNTGKTKESLTSVLRDNALKSVDLIIGPAYSSQLALISRFSQTYKIPTVLPFTSKTKEKLNNKYIFQALCPQNELEQTIIPDFLTLLEGKHLIILQPEMTIMYDKYEFVDSLCNRIDTSLTSYQTIPIPKMAQTVNEIAKSTDKEIILMIPSHHSVPLMRAGEELGQINADNVRLFGFPEWRKIEEKELYDLPMYTFSSYHFNYKTDEIQNFFARFYEAYGMPSTQQPTNFALLGHDICTYFLNQLHENGREFTQLIGTEAEAQAKFLQMDFDFQQSNDDLSFINKGYRLLMLDKNGIQIVK